MTVGVGVAIGAGGGTAGVGAAATRASGAGGAALWNGPQPAKKARAKNAAARRTGPAPELLPPSG